MGGQGRQLSCCSYLWGDSAAGIAVARWMAGWDPCSAAGGLSKDSGGGGSGVSCAAAPACGGISVLPAAPCWLLTGCSMGSSRSHSKSSPCKCA